MKIEKYGQSTCEGNVPQSKKDVADCRYQMPPQEEIHQVAETRASGHCAYEQSCKKEADEIADESKTLQQTICQGDHCIMA